ncbi:MAG: response regulator transcription factor [Candidatus Promineifilaceae bacterium]
MEPKVLIVEDEITLLETLEYNLKRQGYKVATASHGRVGLQLAREFKPDLIVLDVMLPGMDGFEVCRILRREMNAPILMLTARVDEVDKIVGLEMGADDYITKPFSMRELLARVKAQLRRMRLMREEAGVLETPDAVVNPLIEHGNMVIDTDRREVRIENTVLHLKPKEYDLLLFLARNRGIALSRDLILERVWGWANDSSRTADVHVRWLREKIEVDPSKARRIVTVRGVGYRFEG